MTQTATFTPTLMQKFLGRNYKWWYIIKFNFNVVSNYRLSNVFQWLSYIVVVGANLAVWWVNYKNGSTVESFKYIFSYFIIGVIFNSIFESNFSRFISDDIKHGGITTKMLNTSNLSLQYFFKTLGGKFFWNLDIFLWVFIALAGFNFLILPTFLNFTFSILVFFLGMIISSYYSIILGCLAFFVVDTYGVQTFSDEIRNVASGKVIPLGLFWVTNILTYTPFAFTFYHPMQIYLGKYDTNQTILVFLGGIAWCVVLYFLAKLVFKMGLKRNESVGL